ncbi:MAG: hypothetical protein KAY24_17120 [Candidatus Eisenbacteria sp.]|nr:hypothetical protein [Candidatus Eisenbacteria bacterium]
MNRHRVMLVAMAWAILAFSLSTALAFTGPHPKMQVRLAWPERDELTVLREIDDLDPMKVSPGEEIILVSHPEQIERLEALGFRVEIQIADMEEHYASQREGYRNFGDLYTYSEMIAYLDEFHALYPEITTEKYSIGTSIEGRDLWAIKISDNPDVNEDEPEACFDALHHAREPITVNVLIETIRYLCENYGTDPEVTFLVENRETWFVPVVNPDGYVYNEQQYPGGGGMWRKNRRDNAGSPCYGVDPNRNYPYEWGGVGSSSDPCSDIYRGTDPGSEPCTQAMMAFFQNHEFVTHDTYHSVAGMILLPWAYTNQHTPHDALFREMANAMNCWCGYQVGQPGEILYNCSGVTFDWTYGELGMFSFCTEVAGSGFWPSNSEVPGLVAENIPKNLYLMKVAGCYLDLAHVELSGGNGDQKPDPGETLDLVVTLHNSCVIADAHNVSVTLHTDDAYVLLHDAAATLGQIPAGGEGDNSADPFSFTVDPACPVGHKLEVTFDVAADGFALTYTKSWVVGDLPVIFADDMESGVGDWTHQVVTGGFVDEWHQSTQRNHTQGGTTSWKFGDTGSGGYANLSDGALLTPAIPVGTIAQISFWHWMDAEESGSYPGRAYDGGLIEVSVDGSPWEQVTPEAGYTHTIRTGSNPGPFPAGTPVFSGSFDWRQDTVALEGFSGTAQFRFRFGSDGSDTREGWYVDDVEVVGLSTDNLPPSAPALVSPVNGEIVHTSVPTLTVENAIDPNPGSVLTYGFRVFADPLITDLVAAVDGVEEGTTTTAWTVSPPLADGTYYWQSYAFDGIERGPCMAVAYFVVEGSQAVGEVTVAAGLKLLGASPNPAPGASTLRFQLGQSGIVRGGIFDLQGRRVRTLSSSFCAGVQGFEWDGRDERGHAVPAGVYLYTLRGQEGERSGRMLLVR